MDASVHSALVAEIFSRLVEFRDLSRSDAAAVMEEIMSGRAHESQIAALLTALRMKGETVEELVGFAQVLRTKVLPVHPRHPENNSDGLVDTCGTGGDSGLTFNISTAAAFVAAGAGLRVAKHGNRSVSSRCGSADVVEALGVNISLRPDQVAECIDQAGIGFLFAPLLHQAMKRVMPARKELGIRTVFNLLGPLTNPAGASYQVLGVYSDHLTDLLARVLNELGTRRAFVVHGSDRMDEISNTGPTRISEVREGSVRTYRVTPADFGLPTASAQQLMGGSPRDNAAIIRSVLQGAKGPCRDVVLMNAAAAILACGKASSFTEGVKVAGESVDSGAAMARLTQLVALTESLSTGT